MPEASCNGYWHGRPGLDLIEPAMTQEPERQPA